MAGRIQSIYRYPVKGFSPERLDGAELTAGSYFPCDRLYAVENGPSAFKPWAPAFVPKSAFTVLANTPKLARVRTAYDETTGGLTVEAAGYPPFVGELVSERGRKAFAIWLTGFLDADEVRGPLKVLSAPPHRFTDHPSGHISLINLESVRDLSAKMGQPVDPLRFRANLYVEGWPAWAEMSWSAETPIALGSAHARLFKPIVRCAAIEVGLTTGERDMEVVEALFALYGHVYCGVYLNVTQGGRVGEGDAAERIG